MTKVTGVVEIVSAKEWHNVMLYSFQIQGESRWYRLGKTPPMFKEGDTITFEEHNSNVNTSTIFIESSLSGSGEQVSLPAVPVKASTVLRASSEPSVGGRMRYQAARRDAANVVVAALHTDSLPWAANVAKAKKLDLLTGYIEQITKTLLEQENNNVTE